MALSADGDAGSSGADAADAEVLIRQLGAPEYRVRVDAESKLRDLGKQVAAALEKAASAEDPEVKVRARRLLGQIRMPNMFVGNWHSSQFHGAILLNADGTWNGGIHSGRWTTRDGSIVWTYDDENNKREEVNVILTRTPNRFEIREQDGTVTTFTRIQ